MTVPIKVLRYAQRIVEKYDADGDGKLSAGEYEKMRGEPTRADLDGDGRITADEMARHVAAYGFGRKIRLMPPAAEYLIRFRAGVDPEMAIAAGEEVSKGADSASFREPIAGRGAGSSAGAGYKRFSVPASRIPPGLPAWFVERDQDGDLQLTIAEFAPHSTAADRQEFARYDVNGDGLVTAREMVRQPATAP